MLNRLVLLLILNATSSFAGQFCKEGKIKYIYEKETMIKSLELCSDKDKRDVFIYSKNCADLKCEQLKDPAKRPLDLSHYPSSIGSIGFKVCRELKGSPQIIEYQFNNTDWTQTSRCIFDKTTFVSNNLLIKLWKPYIID